MSGRQQHAFVRPDNNLIVNVAHVRGARCGDGIIQILMTTGKEFYLKYGDRAEALDAFEKLWSQLEHLRLPLEG